MIAGRLETAGKWQNTGDGRAFGGGYHSWYSSDTRTLDSSKYVPAAIKKTFPSAKYPKVTPPGPQLFLAPFGDGSLLYGYDNDLKPVIINSSTDNAQMAMNVRRIKGYGSGPLSIENVSTTGGFSTGNRVFFTPNRAGKGWQPVRVNNYESYMKAFGGLNMLGKEKTDPFTYANPYAPAPAWVGEGEDPDGRGGSKSNLSGNPFVPVSMTADDQAAHVWDDFILPIGMEGIFQGLMAGARGLVDMATGGAAELALTAATPLMDAAASELATTVTTGLQKAAGIGRTQPEINEFFTKAIDVPGVMDRNPDPNFLTDIRTEVAQKDYENALAAMGTKVKALQKPDPNLTDEQNADRAKAFTEVYKIYQSKLGDFVPKNELDNPNRDRRKDAANMANAQQLTQKMRLTTAGFDPAVQAVQIKNKVEGSRYMSMVNDSRTEDLQRVLDGFIPDVDSNLAVMNERANNVVKTAASMENKFYENALAEKAKFLEDSKKYYKDIVDHTFGLDEHRMKHIATQADSDRFEQLKTEGKVVDADWDKYVRDKAVAFYKQTGKSYDLDAEIGRSFRDRAKDYKKYRKADNLGGLFEGQTISEEEVKRMENVFISPTMDDWKIEAHAQIHDPDTISIPAGFDTEQRAEAQKYIDSMREPEVGPKTAIVSF